ncbi:MAG: PhzF family phenazine biosynthesis protein [Bdellovibrionales bacterium]
MSFIDVFLVDAFASELFSGCPAAVCVLPKWVPDELLQSITTEHNQSETAFIVQKDDGFDLRWFTTSIGEIDLCGHATMAAAHVIFDHLNYQGNEIKFYTRFSGDLNVKKEASFLTLDLPSWVPSPVEEAPKEAVLGCGGKAPKECHVKREYMLVYESEEDIRNIVPDFKMLAKLDRWVSVTAPGLDCDFVSRFFCPGEPLEEDPVTGSAHSMLVPYWAKRLNKDKLFARQLSQRGGALQCELQGERVLLSGQAQTFSAGKIFIEV